MNAAGNGGGGGGGGCVAIENMSLDITAAKGFGCGHMTENTL